MVRAQNAVDRDTSVVRRAMALILGGMGIEQAPRLAGPLSLGRPTTPCTTGQLLFSQTARMSHYGACLAPGPAVVADLPEICQRRRLVTLSAAPLDLESPPRLSCDDAVQRMGS